MYKVCECLKTEQIYASITLIIRVVSFYTQNRVDIIIILNNAKININTIFYKICIREGGRKGKKGERNSKRILNINLSQRKTIVNIQYSMC